MVRTLIQGGMVVTPNDVQQFDILIEGGLITDLIHGDTGIGASRIIDAKGKIILPGAIDGHAHFIPHDPDSDHPLDVDNEGFNYGGRAAAGGGVTSIVEMPQAYPPTVDGASFERKRSVAQPQAIVDFAMWGGIPPGENMEQNIKEQVESGAAALKAYMCNEDPDLPLINDAEMLQALEWMRDAGIMLGLHTENESLLRHYLAQVQSTGRTDPLAHAESRPPILEAADVNRAIHLAEQSGGWVHIVHLNAIESAELVRRAKARGVRITAETCPHYLALDLTDLERLGPLAKCVPTLRSRDEVEELWTYLADGTIDCIASDHCGWTIASKKAGLDNIWVAPNGLTGVQTLLPVVITEAHKRGFSWEDIARWTATKPAKLWRLGPKKGSIRIGADADFAIIDPELEWTLQAADLLHAQPWSPFVGRTFRGKVVKTMLRGELIFDVEDPKVVLVEPGYGKFLKPN
jgi:allantoinase